MTTVVEQTAPATFGPITALDRCDGCRAQAYTRFVNEAQQDLLFCGHHTTRNEGKLMTDGFQMVQDDRDKLQIKRESSAA